MAHVLIIDGDDSSREDLAEVLREEHRTETASDERASVFLLMAEEWDVVVMDPTHPELGGASIMRHITEMGASRPEVVVVTRQNELDAVIETLRAGAFEFVAKPCQPAEVRKVVANAAQLRSFRERKRQLEQQNRQQREQLQALVEQRTHQMTQLFSNVPAMLFRLVSHADGSLEPTFVSPHCERVLGIPAEDLQNNTDAFLSLVHPEDLPRFRSEMRFAEQHGERMHFEGRFSLPSGTMRWFECVCQPNSQADGRLCWDGLLLDVSERKELQSQLVLADRLATVGSLSASVAHEVNNPLAYVFSSLTALKDGLSQRGLQDLATLAEDALGGLERIETTVRDLRTFARSPAEREQQVRVNEVIEASVRLASNEIRHRASLNKQFEGDLRVLVDESNLGQVFLNLLVACAQSIPEGDAQSHQINIRVLRKGDHARIELSDNGPGLPEDLLSSAFEALPTGHSLRAGMGLYVCRRIVASAGGNISALRHEGGGNRFVVTLPLVPDEAKLFGDGPTLRALPDQPSRVLVVDDEDLVVTALVRALDGHQVTCARSGREAIDLLRASGPFDLIICDVMMPDMTGADVYKAARRLEPGGEGRIVFMTGGAFTPAARDFLDRVPNRRIGKPFSRNGIRALVDEVGGRG